MEGLLLMSKKERERKVEMAGVAEGKMTIREASDRLGLSYRQCRRVWKRYSEEGDAGLVHRGRGRRSPHAKPLEFREAVLARYTERYGGFGPTLASEKLAEEDGYRVHPETLRRWLIAEGMWKRKRKRGKHRQRRERRARFGELVQMDGSHHAWFGAGGPPCCLVEMVDDATGIRHGLLAAQETTVVCMQALWQWIERYGVPQALYTDKKNVFVADREPTREEQLAGQPALTAFGKACWKLGVEIIEANSPQAKGRVERAHAVLQDRFVKELRLKQITTIEQGNELLQNGFMDSINRKFARPAADQTDCHRPVPAGTRLEQIFVWEETRVVSNDWTVRWHNRFFQIARRNEPLPRPRDKVIVRRLLDDTIQIVYRDTALRFKECDGPDTRPRYQQPLADAPESSKTARKKHRPAEDHPWRRYRRSAGTQEPVTP